MNISDIIQKFFEYWISKGCMHIPASNYVMGAATFHPQLFWGIKKSSNNNFAYLQPCMRRADGMYGKSSNRLALHHQLQVVMQPAPADFRAMCYEFLNTIGINEQKHLIQLVDSQWSSDTLGASGNGWEVRVNTLEIMQFTYFDRFAHKKLDVQVGELAFGMERLAVILQGLPIMECQWAPGVKYKDLFLEQEEQLYQYYSSSSTITKSKFDEYVNLANSASEPRIKYEYFLAMNDMYNCLDARNLLKYEDKKSMMKIMSNFSYELHA